MNEAGDIRHISPVSLTGLPLAPLTAIAVAVVAAWWAITALSARPPARLRAAILATFGTGAALSLLPLLPLSGSPSWQAGAERMAQFGLTLTGFAVLATVVVLVWVLTAALIDRL